MNGGVCSQPNIGSFVCTCPCGYTGSHCETRLSFCATNTTYCQNGATCVELQACSVISFETDNISLAQQLNKTLFVLFK